MDLLTQFLPSSEPRPGLHPLPGTSALTLQAALSPPLIYYAALILLPPLQGPNRALVGLVRNCLAALAAVLFFRLPLAYHVPFSVGLTYQLGLVGLYGGGRVLDAFFISPYIFRHIPRRVTYRHMPRASTPGTGSEMQLRGGESYFDHVVDTALLAPKTYPVTELASTEPGWPTSWADRASWALELELSMRGVGFTWTTADVRHSRKTWLPSVGNRLHSMALQCGPVIGAALAWLRYVYVMHLHGHENGSGTYDDRAHGAVAFDALPLGMQLATTAALGGFLMAAFSLGHSAFAVLLHWAVAPHPLSYFPPLYTTRVWNVRSVRGFWSYGWHRLFARLFLVYGVWPGEWAERRLLGKGRHEPADAGKVLGAFLSSAFVHAFAVRTVVGGSSGSGSGIGSWLEASGEAVFFAENGAAVVVEELFCRAVLRWRKRRELPLEQWYDGVVGRIWWVSVLLLSGRNFARGWVKAGLVREMSGL